MDKIQAKFVLPINAEISRLSPECGITFGRWGPVWNQFIETGQGFGIGVKDCGGETGRVFGLVSNATDEPIVVLTEEAVGALWRILNNPPLSPGKYDLHNI